MKGYYVSDDCRIADFQALVGQELDQASLSYARSVEKNIPIYEAASLGPMLADPTQRPALMAEWASILGETSGVLVLKGAIKDIENLDAASEAYEQIIAQEKAAGAGGDHFATSGANDRVWNAAQKLCIAAPEVFARYFASPSIAAVCEAWLGPHSQLTAQINLVRPGGKAQVVHRDYHLGFMNAEQAAAFPKKVHDLSPLLTLQGAIAHCDMPIKSGPTKLLPFSQLYPSGYLASQLPAFRSCFEENYVQMPLEKGDAVFFNPALFHAAGENVSSNIQRMANLLQISSAMGRSIEAVDRAAMVQALFPVLRHLRQEPLERRATIAAAAEGYAFPANLDRDPPVSGLMGESQAELLARALDEGMDIAAFNMALSEHAARRIP